VDYRSAESYAPFKGIRPRAFVPRHSNKSIRPEGIPTKEFLAKAFFQNIPGEICRGAG
jgi:hypothetical protein